LREEVGSKRDPLPKDVVVQRLRTASGGIGEMWRKSEVGTTKEDLEKEMY